MSSLLVLDFIGVARRRCSPRCAQAGCVIGNLERQPGLARHQALARLRLPDHGADVRPGRSVRRSPAPAGAEPDRHGAVPGHGDRARVRAGQRRALLELLHLLRLAVLRHRLHRRPARAPPARHGLAARAGRLPAAGAAGRLGQAHRGGGPRARRPRRVPGSTWSATSRSRRGRRMACARWGSSTICPRSWPRADPGGDHRRPRLPPGAGGRAGRPVPPARRDRPGGALDDGDPDRPGRVRARPDGAAVQAPPAGVRGHRLRAQADLRPRALGGVGLFLLSPAPAGRSPSRSS